MSKVKVNGLEVDFDAAVELMDDDLREEIHYSYITKSEQHFIDIYCDRHRDIFDEEFTVN